MYAKHVHLIHNTIFCKYNPLPPHDICIPQMNLNSGPDLKDDENFLGHNILLET